MISAHLATYDNLRAVCAAAHGGSSLWRCIIEFEQFGKPGYLERLLQPTFGDRAAAKAAQITARGPQTPKQTEDAINQFVINDVFTEYVYSVPLFRALCDRLLSLRLLNIMRATAMAAILPRAIRRAS